MNCLDFIFLCHLMCMLPVQDPDNIFTDKDFIFDEEEELEYENEEEKSRPYQNDGLHETYQKESRIEGEVVYRILNGKSHTLKPNSGETVMIRENNIVVGFHLDDEGGCIVWEWHGHIARYTEELQFSLEYIYGNYFQRIVPEDTHRLY
ncbi:uncharacterized protein LOC131614732 [Vicia villosa]|uniref:uncharacterized protein LOC131614732 n=1 Tax=Vicia villosa TaxID=3911 RepID=UPI00273BFFBC|nr:uncharacterized protein LOC131614732 [Vicia villosa]